MLLCNFTDPCVFFLIFIGQEYNLKEALERELIVKSKTSVSLEDSIECGLFDPKTGLFVNPATQESLPLDEAIMQGLINLNSILVKDTKSGRYISAEDAINAGILDKAKATVRDTARKRDVPLNEAIDKGLLLLYARSLSLYQALTQEEIYNQENQTFFDPKTSEDIKLSEAIETNLIDTNQIAVHDPRTNKLMSLAEAVKKGYLDLDESTFINPLTGDKITLHEAWAKGFIVKPPLKKEEYRVEHISPQFGKALLYGREAIKVCRNIFRVIALHISLLNIMNVILYVTSVHSLFCYMLEFYYTLMKTLNYIEKFDKVYLSTGVP